MPETDARPLPPFAEGARPGHAPNPYPPGSHDRRDWQLGREWAVQSVCAPRSASRIAIHYARSVLPLDPPS